MPTDHAAVFAALKPVLSKHVKKFQIKADDEKEYTVVSRVPSPFPQHKGEPLFFASVRNGKAYVSFHLLPLYMCPELNKKVAPALKKRMQGKACFNFKSAPEQALLTELATLTAASIDLWKEKKWL